MLTALEGPCEDVRPMARASRASHFNIHDLAAESDLLLLKLMTVGPSSWTHAHIRSGLGVFTTAV